MRSLALFLVLTASLYSSVQCSITVFADASSCVHMMCEWRGVGKHCKDIDKTGKKKTLKDASELHDPDADYYDEFESRNLTRIQEKHPFNTFTISNERRVTKLCQGRRLWCNTHHMISVEDYDEFLDYTYKWELRIDCQPSFSPS
uniref:Uncharacterized protein n=1 Tax=Caenorhabditis tropicalis TaxID=1561998 RepID=A0A1I7V440_9PELO